MKLAHYAFLFFIFGGVCSSAEVSSFTVSSFTLNLETGYLVVSFDSDVSSTDLLDETDLRFAPARVPVSSQRLEPLDSDISILSAPSSSSLALQLETSFLNQLKATKPFGRSPSTTYLNVGPGFVLGSSGTLDAFVSPLSLTADLTPPNVTALSLDKVRDQVLTLNMLCSEPLGQIPSIFLLAGNVQYELQALALNHVFGADDVTAELTISVDDSTWPHVKNIDAELAMVQLDNVVDVYGNEAAGPLTLKPTRLHVDVQPPFVTAVAVDLDASMLVVEVSEPVMINISTGVVLSLLSLGLPREHVVLADAAATAQMSNGNQTISLALSEARFYVLLLLTDDHALQIEIDVSFAADQAGNQLDAYRNTAAVVSPGGEFTVLSATYDLASGCLDLETDTPLVIPSIDVTSIVLGTTSLTSASVLSYNDAFNMSSLQFISTICLQPSFQGELSATWIQSLPSQLTLAAFASDIFERVNAGQQLPLSIRLDSVLPSVASVLVSSMYAESQVNVTLILDMSEAVQITNTTVELWAAGGQFSHECEVEQLSLLSVSILCVFDRNETGFSFLKSMPADSIFFLEGNWCRDVSSNVIDVTDIGQLLNQVDVASPYVQAATFSTDLGLVVFAFSEPVLFLSELTEVTLQSGGKSYKLASSRFSIREQFVLVSVSDSSVLAALSGGSPVSVTAFAQDASLNVMEPTSVQVTPMVSPGLEFVGLDRTDMSLLLRFDVAVSPLAVNTRGIALSSTSSRRRAVSRIFYQLTDSQAIQGEDDTEVRVMFGEDDVSVINSISGFVTSVDNTFVSLLPATFLDNNANAFSGISRDAAYQVQAVVQDMVTTSAAPLLVNFGDDDDDDFPWYWIACKSFLICSCLDVWPNACLDSGCTCACMHHLDYIVSLLDLCARSPQASSCCKRSRGGEKEHKHSSSQRRERSRQKL